MVLAFAELERSASRAIARVLSATEAEGEAVAAELPFQKKLHLLASLVRLNARPLTLNALAREPSEVFAELAAECFRAEELRNVLMHSAWEPIAHEPDRMLRYKRSAKAKRGLHTDVGVVSAQAVLDVADFISHAASGLDIFFAGPPVELP